MPKLKTIHPLAAGLLACALAFATFGPAAAQNSRAENARIQYEKDRAACDRHTEVRDKNACLKEARNVYAGRKKGAAASQPVASNSNFEQNRLERCKMFSGDDRSQCERRIQNGPVEGSVIGGGVLYEASTRDIYSDRY